MKRLKLAFFADLLIREYVGCLRTVFNIIDRIPAERFDVRFFCGPSQEKSLPFPVIRTPSLKIPMNSDYDMALPFLAKTKLETELNRFSPDIIHITTPSPLGRFALRYAKKNKTAVSTIYHTHYISYMEYYFRHLPALIPIAKKAVTKLSRQFYEACDKVFMPTTEMVESFKLNNISTENVIIWPRGIDRNIFNPLKADKEKLQALIGNDNPNILFASRLVWEKNLETLIRIYKLAVNQKLKLNFIIAGDGAAREELEAKMPSAYFTGKLDQEELALYYASSDVFAFPSISETYGNVVVEAMASGCACVIADGGGSRSFIKHHFNGFLCEPNNEEEYLQRIIQIIDDNNLKQKFRMNSFSLVKKISWSSLVDQYFKELELLAKTTNSDKILAA